MDLLRFTTAGSVDDGKSTLIGRLLYDTKSIFEDQLQALADATRRRGEEGVNLALLTDGLRAEREQNITIDVAYRYFATPRRKFIIADTPGHVQYTRNMVTGASTADLAVVLVDARKGVQTQSRRHGYIASLLRIPHIVVAVNKMDLVDYSQESYDAIVDDYRRFSETLDIEQLTFIPISALRGDNVVEPSAHMPWHFGTTLLEHLETVRVARSEDAGEFRFPVQYVIRPHQDFRGFAGRIASGTIRPGAHVTALPGGQATRILSIETADGAVAEASAGDSVVLTIEHEIDISRGEMLALSENLPESGTRFQATLCWLNEQPLDPSKQYALMHTTRQVQAFVSVEHRIDVDKLVRTPAYALAMNDIGVVQISTAHPIFFDQYEHNRATGSFILIDAHTNVTVAAGMIRGSGEAVSPKPRMQTASRDVVWQESNIPRSTREQRNGHRAAVLWFTGLSGAGKTTIARALEQRLYASGVRTALLDGDQLRHGLNGDLDFSEDGRRENIRRAAEVARLFYEQANIVLCTFISPFRDERERVRARFQDGRFVEVHVHADLATCESRDPKGLYARARAGQIVNLTGVGSPYEAPESPELRFDTGQQNLDSIVDDIIARLEREEIL